MSVYFVIAGQKKEVIERGTKEQAKEASQRLETPAEMMGNVPWSADEQKLLEQARVAIKL